MEYGYIEIPEGYWTTSFIGDYEIIWNWYEIKS
jgi:hypothetical protein